MKTETLGTAPVPFTLATAPPALGSGGSRAPTPGRETGAPGAAAARVWASRHGIDAADPDGSAESTSDWQDGESRTWHPSWGTAYARHLRRLCETLSEDQWVAAARTLAAPGPWLNLGQMRDRDLRALYRTVLDLGLDADPDPDASRPSASARSLGPAGPRGTPETIDGTGT